MSGIKTEVTDKVDEVRDKAPIVDHLIKMQGHFGKVQANQQAGGVTYFAFLSFFPLLAIAFFVIGIVSSIYPDARQNLVDGISSALPNLIAAEPGDDGIQLSDIEDSAGAVGIIGLATLLYSGLNWLSALRLALIVVFELPEREKPNFVVGKLRDLATLAIIGFVLVFSVALSGIVTKLSGAILDLVGLGDVGILKVVLILLGIALGLAANVALFFSMFKLLTDTETPRRALLEGALFGAIGFEILKQAATFILKGTASSPAFQVFGIALVLVVWINYSTRLILYAAAFAYTAPEAIEARGLVEGDPVQGPQVPDISTITATSTRPTWVGPFAAGGAAMLGLIAFVRSRLRPS